IQRTVKGVFIFALGTACLWPSLGWPAEPATGKTMYVERLHGVSTLARPVATADGRIYFVTTGKSYVTKAGPKLASIRRDAVRGDGVRGWDLGSSPAVSKGRIFVRDGDGLYCIGKK